MERIQCVSLNPYFWKILKRYKSLHTFAAARKLQYIASNEVAINILRQTKVFSNHSQKYQKKKKKKSSQRCWRNNPKRQSYCLISGNDNVPYQKYREIVKWILQGRTFERTPHWWLRFHHRLQSKEDTLGGSYNCKTIKMMRKTMYNKYRKNKKKRQRDDR